VVFPMGRITNAKARAFATFAERAIDPARADRIGHPCDAGPRTEIAASMGQPSRSEDCAIGLRHSPNTVGQAMISSP
jgi:hypothetical protein